MAHPPSDVVSMLESIQRGFLALFDENSRLSREIGDLKDKNELLSKRLEEAKGQMKIDRKTIDALTVAYDTPSDAELVSQEKAPPAVSDKHRVVKRSCPEIEK